MDLNVVEPRMWTDRVGLSPGAAQAGAVDNSTAAKSAGVDPGAARPFFQAERNAKNFIVFLYLSSHRFRMNLLTEIPLASPQDNGW